MSAHGSPSVIVVGLGEMGRLHARCLNGLGALAACCDPRPQARDAAPPGVSAYESLAAAIEAVGNPDGVVVCTPPDAHVEPVRLALQSGASVLCEKPLAIGAGDLETLRALDSGHPGKLHVGHIRRFDSRFVAVRDAVLDGRVGRPLALSGLIECPRRDAERLADRVTLALELAIHDLDVMRWLAGDIVRVSAEAVDKFATRGPDLLCATIRFASGAIGSLHHGWTMHADSGLESEFRFRVTGEHGIAEIDGRDSGVSVLGSGATPLYPDTQSWPAIGSNIGGALGTEDAAFLACISGRADWPLTVADASAAVEAALAMDESIASGRPVCL